MTQEGTPDKQTLDWTLLRRLFGLTRPYRKWLWLSGLLAVVLAPLNTLQPYLINVIVFLVIVRLWYSLSPAAWTPVWIAFLSAQIYLLLRVWARLSFIASEIVFFQGELAHAGYTAAPPARWPDSAAVEARQMIRPPLFCATIARATAWDTRNVPLRLVSSSRSQASSSISSTDANEPAPALFTRMSIRPNSVKTESTI